MRGRITTRRKGDDACVRATLGVLSITRLDKKEPAGRRASESSTPHPFQTGPDRGGRGHGCSQESSHILALSPRPSFKQQQQQTPPADIITRVWTHYLRIAMPSASPGAASAPCLESTLCRVLLNGGQSVAGGRGKARARARQVKKRRLWRIGCALGRREASGERPGDRRATSQLPLALFPPLTRSARFEPVLWPSKMLILD